MSVSVFVVDKRGKPLDPCRPSRARKLLQSGRARVHRLFPFFTIRLVDRTLEESIVHPTLIKFDPGSKETGVAVVRVEEREDGTRVHHALAFAKIIHRREPIHEKMLARKSYRKHRRAKLRHRAPRFDNRKRPEGWLPPSQRHCVDTIRAIGAKLMRYLPMCGFAVETVKFDTQKLMNPEISGVEYQQGTLAGNELRAYLLEKFQYACVYCGAKHVPLTIDHVVPRAKGGTNRVSNLVIACCDCNQKKGAMPVEEFLKKKPEVLKKIKTQLKESLKGAAAMNTTRKVLPKALEATGLPVKIGSGAQTAFNRHRLGLAKEHWIDALCVGNVSGITIPGGLNVLQIFCMGRGRYRRTNVDRYGFPRGYLMRKKRVHGFATGDMVEAIVLKGKRQGRWRGRVLVRTKGRFDIQTAQGRVAGINWKYCRLLSHSDGYRYAWLSQAS